jgi:hypothetical protein
MGVTVKCVDQGCVVEFFCAGPERAVLDCDFELTACIEAPANVLAEDIQHLLNTCKGILEPKEGNR